MVLNGKYVVLIEGGLGTRTEDIAGLIAAGVKHITTQLENTDSTIATEGKTTSGIGVVILNVYDTSWGMVPQEPGGRKVRTWVGPGSHDSIKIGQRDVMRRLRVAINAGIPFIIVCGPLTDIARAITKTADQSGYEVCPFFSADVRKTTIGEREASNEDVQREAVAFASSFPLFPRLAALVNASNAGIVVHTRQTLEQAAQVSAPAREEKKEITMIVFLSSVDTGATGSQQQQMFLRWLGVKKLSTQRNICWAVTTDSRPQIALPAALTKEAVERRAKEVGFSVEFVTTLQ